MELGDGAPSRRRRSNSCWRKRGGQGGRVRGWSEGKQRSGSSVAGRTGVVMSPRSRTRSYEVVATGRTQLLTRTGRQQSTVSGKRSQGDQALTNSCVLVERLTCACYQAKISKRRLAMLHTFSTEMTLTRKSFESSLKDSNFDSFDPPLAVCACRETKSEFVIEYNLLMYD